MPVVKAHTFNPARKDAVVLDLGDLGRQAAKLRALAEQQSETILAEARQEAAELTAGAEAVGQKQGYDAGFAQGLEEGRGQGKQEALVTQKERIDALIAQWSAALSDFEAQRAGLEREARAAVLRLAVCFAEKVVHRVVDANPDAVLDQVRQTLGLVMEPTRATVRVHPDDHTAVADALPALTAEFDAVEHAEAVPDPGVSAGGCVMTYGPGRIDATIETQLSRLSALLLGDQASFGSPENGATGEESEPGA